MLAAAAAIPSVYTLASGAQTAVASNFRCWAREPEAGPPDRCSFHPDGWLRKQVYQGKHQGQVAFCAMWDQTACVDPVNPNKAAFGSVWLCNDQRVVADQGENITHIAHSPHAYALVYTDQFGTIATLNPDAAQDLRPVRENCWTSLIGSQSSHLG